MNLNTGLFLRTCLGGGGGGGIYKKGPYYAECGDKDDRWLLLTKTCTLGVFSPRLGFCIFPPLELVLKCEHFLRQTFGYTALHCAMIDRISLVKYLHDMFM